MPILLLLFIFLHSVAYAATSSEPAYRMFAVTAGYPVSEGIVIDFYPDEERCKREYGMRWRINCAAAVGNAGSAARGIKLAPQVLGSWKWQTGSSLVFEPANGAHLTPDTQYAIDLGNLAFPSYISLNRKKALVKTMPPAARLLESRFFIDPAPTANHRLFASFEFNFPVREGFLPILELPQNISCGKPDFVWNPSRDKLNISWQLRKLPDMPGQARYFLPGFGYVTEDNGRIKYTQSGKKGAEFSQNIPGSNSLFKIMGLELSEDDDAALNRKYVLKITSSLYAKAGELLKNLVVMELPEFASKEVSTPFDWSRAGRVDYEAVKKSRILTPTPMQQEEQTQSVFKFQIPVNAGRHLFIRIDPAFTSASGQKLQSPWYDIVHAAPMTARIGFTQPGHVLANADKLDIYANGIDRINWKIQILDDSFLALLAQSSDNPFKEPFERLQYTGIGMDSFCHSSFDGNLSLPDLANGKAWHGEIDLEAILKKNDAQRTGIALVKLTGLQNDQEVASAQKLILIGDMGLILKKDAEGMFACFVNSLTTGKPVPNARVAILGKNGRELAQAFTDANGAAHIANVLAINPQAVIASKDGQISWLPLNDESRVVDFTGYATGGRHVAHNAVIAHVFSQRGMYRPGDTLYFGCLFRQANFTPFPAQAPLYAEIIDPAGQCVFEKVFHSDKNGLADIAWRSSESSLTGNYILNIRFAPKGDILGCASVKLQEFLPETMQLSISAPKIPGWIVVGENDSVETEAELRNLYGTPAKEHAIAGKIIAEPARFVFKGWESYIFNDPAPFIGAGQTRPLPDVKTDAKGKAVIGVPAEVAHGNSARVTVAAEGFDLAGGRATSAAVSFLVSPVDKILGWRAQGNLTNFDFVPCGSDAAIEIAAISNHLERVAYDKLKFSLLKRSYVTSLIADSAGGYRYDETPQELVIKSWQESVGKTGHILPLDTASPGEYLFLIASADGRTLARISYNVVGNILLDANSQLVPAKMRMRLDADAYNAGDEISVAVSLPYAAAGLISIERENIASFMWVKAHAGDNIFKIGIPPNFIGKGHVVATFMRDPASPLIYMNPFAWAACPFTANMAQKDMRIKLDSPKSSTPGKDLEIKVSAAKPGSLLLYAVDQGILSLTGYELPSPLYSLLEDRALDVKTLQIMDLLMPEHARIASRIAAFGGGTDLARTGAKFQNPFKRRNEPPVCF